MNNPKVFLTDSLNAWKTPAFKEILKEEIERLGSGVLPLQQALSQGNYAKEDDFTVVVLNFSEDADCVHAKTGIFYSGIIAGCSCADDPTTVDEHTEYCEVQFDIDKATSETTVTLLPEY
ncbi:MAG: hypothetical protein EP297_12235 [Gammaproteobacteria bacterium]|nr:MAG: hypothetical protein EP297_12235 [Gammaproteobacteria bacterium]